MIKVRGFLAGIRSVLTLGLPVRESFPFEYPHNAISKDWSYVGKDLYNSLKKAGKKNETAQTVPSQQQQEEISQ